MARPGMFHSVGELLSAGIAVWLWAFCLWLCVIAALLGLTAAVAFVGGLL